MKSLMRVLVGGALLSLAVACGSEKTPADAPAGEDLEAGSDASVSPGPSSSIAGGTEARIPISVVIEAVMESAGTPPEERAELGVLLAGYVAVLEERLGVGASENPQAMAYREQAMQALREGDLEEVERALERAVESERNAAIGDATEARLQAASETLEQLALVSLLGLDYEGSVARYYEAAEVLPPDADLSRANVLIELGAMQLRAEQSEAARDPFEEALRLRKRRLGNLHPEVAAGFVQLGDAYQASGALDRAETLYQRALDIHGSAGSIDSENAAEAKEKLIGVYRLQGKDTDADALAGMSGNV